MGNNVFLIADPHFTHQGMCRFVDKNGEKVRPWTDAAEMDEALIENWNATVKQYDKVYVLGDFAIAKKSIAIAGRLNGKKVLIRGNHDIFALKDYTPWFYDVRGSHKLDNFVLTHIPIHPDSLARWTRGNIHGHLHTGLVYLNNEPDPRYINVCVERINYTPIALEAINKQFLKGTHP